MTRSGDWVVVVNAPKVAFPSCFFMPDRAERLDPTSEWMHSVPIDTQAVRATLRPVPPRHQPQKGICRNGLILRLTDHVSNHPTLTTLGGPK